MKIDLKKEFKYLYSAPSTQAVLADVPKLKYIMIDGEGNPNTSLQFRQATEALYGVSYTLKFTVKKSDINLDYITVMALEVIGEPIIGLMMDKKEIWKWTLMILQPEFITCEMFEKARSDFEKKKNSPAVSKLRFESLKKGPVLKSFISVPIWKRHRRFRNCMILLRKKGIYSTGNTMRYIWETHARRLLKS